MNTASFIKHISSLKLSILLVATCSLVACVVIVPIPHLPQDHAASAKPEHAIPPGYKLVWSDNFNQPALNTSVWNIRSNHRDMAFQTADSVTTGPNGLNIKTWQSNGQIHTGFIDTAGKYTTRYGYFEAQMRFHGESGEHCAFWLQSPDNNGKIINDPAQSGTEIDIVEHRKFDKNNKDISRFIPSTLHWNGYGAFHQSVSSSQYGQYTAPVDVDGRWHTYALLWTAQSYTFYFDGHPYWSTTAAVSQVPEYMMLTCEVGGGHGWAGSIPANGYADLQHSHVGMDVRYVRVYQKPM